MRNNKNNSTIVIITVRIYNVIRAWTTFGNQKVEAHIDVAFSAQLKYQKKKKKTTV